MECHLSHVVISRSKNSDPEKQIPTFTILQIFRILCKTQELKTELAALILGLPASESLLKTF